jgi:ubiquinone/menaquinone biosynthesis C-methylase UbiE
LAGLDGAAAAIEVARSRPGASQIDFRVGSTDALPWPDGAFDVAILQGVLHHTADPGASVAEALRVAGEVVCVEPNGYSPVLKVLERFSPYHRAHEERSFSAATLRRWVVEAGGRVTDERFAILVPYFCPDALARLLKLVEPMVERLPVVRRYLLAVYVFRAVRDPG